jgi:hypothetical protein
MQTQLDRCRKHEEALKKYATQLTKASKKKSVRELQTAMKKVAASISKQLKDKAHYGGHSCPL